MRLYKLTTKGRTPEPNRARFVKVINEQELGEISDFSDVESIKPLPLPEFFTAYVLGDDDTFYVSLVDCMGDDLSPLRNARMSTDNPTGVSEEKDSKLRNRLWRDRHTSPFESVVIAYELVVPMFVLRQIDRHRTVSVSNMTMEVLEDYDETRKFTSRNEFSARYSEMPETYYVPPEKRFRGKSVSNKQGSGDDLGADAQRLAQSYVSVATDHARSAYEALLKQGVAGELARIVLPQNQATKIRLQATLLNWLHFLDLRLRSDVQEETRAYAKAIAKSIEILYPKAYAAFEEHTLEAKRLSRAEVVELVAMLKELPPCDPSSMPARIAILTKLETPP